MSTEPRLHLSFVMSTLKTINFKIWFITHINIWTFIIELSIIKLID
ncbi:MAG: hypothetical protein LN560_01725 [Rickettsia endosymbiont of Sceptobius lativentris]|nr:hypothetical protein [Rickettsia endosymbiont of Sceptobius lativentris]